MNNMYAALIIDIKESREMDDKIRFKCQKKLLDVITFMNEVNAGSLIEKMVFSSGDSVQALFTDCSSAFACYLFIKYLMYPYEIHCGIGYGKINEYIKTSNKEGLNSNFMDGECYHKARIAIDRTKINNCGVLFKTDSKQVDLIINQQIYSFCAIERELSKKQQDIFDAFNLFFPINLCTKQISSNYPEIIISYLYKNITKYIPVTDKELYLEMTSKVFKGFRANQTIDDLADADGLLLKESIFDKDLSLYVAKILNVSRENIRQIANAGKFNLIRKMQISVFMILETIVGGTTNDN